MNRRRFLGSAAVATAAFAAPRALQSAEAARRLTGRLLGRHPFARGREVAAGPRIARLRTGRHGRGVAGGARGVRRAGARFLEPEALVAASEVVFVESAVADHARHALLALRAGKHVHVEKPPADNLAEVEEMVRLARSTGSVMQVGYMWRYHPGFAAIFEAARQGWLGEIVFGARDDRQPARRGPASRNGRRSRAEDCSSWESHLVDALIRVAWANRARVTPFPASPR